MLAYHGLVLSPEEEIQLKSFTIHALVRNCFLQGSLELGPNLKAIPLGQLPGFSEEALVSAFLNQITGRRQTLNNPGELAREFGESQPVSVVMREGIAADGPEAAETEGRSELTRAIRILSLVTGNAGEILAFVVSCGSETWVRVVPSQSVRRIRMGFGNTGPQYEATLRQAFDNTGRNARLELLFSLLYDARKEDNRDFRFLKLWTLLDVASQHVAVAPPPLSDSEAANRIKELFRQMNVGLSMGPIDATYTHSEDIIDITRIVRNRTAHDGRFDPSHPRVPQFCRDAASHLDQVLDQVAAYSEVAVGFLANRYFS